MSVINTLSLPPKVSTEIEDLQLPKDVTLLSDVATLRTHLAAFSETRPHLFIILFDLHTADRETYEKLRCATIINRLYAVNLSLNESSIIAGPWLSGRYAAHPLSWPRPRKADLEHSPIYFAPHAVEKLEVPSRSLIERQDQIDLLTVAIKDCVNRYQAQLTNYASNTLGGRIYLYERQDECITARSWRVALNPDEQVEDETVRCMVVEEANPYADTYLSQSKLSRFYQLNTQLLPHFRSADVINKEGEAASVSQRARTHEKRFKKSDSIPLPLPGKIEASFASVLQRRRSKRAYLPKALSLETLSTLLQYSHGVTARGRIKQTGEPITFRTAPSGGGTCAISLFVLANRVENLKEGVYYYDAPKHALHHIVTTLTVRDLAARSAYRDSIMCSALTLLLAAHYLPNQIKYQERGYRVVQVEAGHVSQTCHLTATALDLKSCVLMGFDEIQAGRLLGLIPGFESVTSLLTVGQ